VDLCRQGSNQNITSFVGQGIPPRANQLVLHCRHSFGPDFIEVKVRWATGKCLLTEYWFGASSRRSSPCPTITLRKRQSASASSCPSNVGTCPKKFLGQQVRLWAVARHLLSRTLSAVCKEAQPMRSLPSSRRASSDAVWNRPSRTTRRDP